MSAVQTLPLITCAWCDKPIAAGPHARLGHSKSIGSAAAARAYFHLQCSDEIQQLCDRRRIEAKPSPAPTAEKPKPKPKPKPRALPKRTVPGSPKTQPAAKLAPLDDAREQIQDLATRGFKPQMIAAQLRVPYAAVAAALGGAR